MTLIPPAGTGGGKKTGGGGLIPPVGTGVTTPKTGKKTPPAVQLVRTASRALRAVNKQYPKEGTAVLPSGERGKAFYNVGQLLEGLSQEEIYKIGTRAKLPPGDIDQVVAGSRYKQAVPVEVPLGKAADILGRPVQAVKGAVVEGRSGQGVGLTANPIEAAKGAYRGVSGQERYGGAETVGVGYGGLTKKEGREWAKSLPAGVRVPLDIAVDVGLDPLTYVTLGGGAIAQNAARTVAKRAAGQGAEALTLTKLSNTIYDDMAKYGLKGGLERHLNPTEVNDILSQLPKSVQRQANKLRPGVYFAGKRIPGSAGVRLGRDLEKLRRLGPKQTGAAAAVGDVGMVASAENVVRTRGSTRQAVRAGEIPESSIQDVENLIVRMRSGDTAGSMAERAVYKSIAYDIGETLPRTFRAGLGKDAMERAFIREGEKWLQQNPDSLEKIYRAIDEGAGPEVFASMSPTEQAIANRVRQIRDKTYSEKIGLGRIVPEEEARAAVKQAAASTKGVDRKIDQQAARVVKQGEKAAQTEQKAATAKQAYDEAVAVDMARAQAAVDARNVSRADALELRDIRRVQAENAREAAYGLRPAKESLSAANRAVKAARAAIDDAARPVRRLEKLIRQARKAAKEATTPVSRQRALDRVGTFEAQLIVAREQNDLLQSSLNDQLNAALDARESARRQLSGVQSDLQAFAVRERPNQVGLPRRPGAPKPLISKEQARRLKAFIKAQERARVAAKEEGKLTRGLTRLQERQAKYVAEADVVPAEQYLRRYPSGEVLEQLPRRAGGEVRPGVGGKGPGYARARKVRGPAAEATIKLGGKDAPLFDLNPVRSVAKDAADVARDTTRINLGDQMRNTVVTLPEGEFPALIDDPELIKRLVDDPESTVLDSYRKTKMPVFSNKQDEETLFKFLDEADDETLNRLTRDDLLDPRIKEQDVYIHESLMRDFDQAKAIALNKGKGYRALAYITALWSASGVATFGFVSRNVLQGNLVLAMMAGALKPADLLEWGRMLGLFKRANRGLQRFGDFGKYLTAQEAAFIKNAFDNGVLTGSFQQYMDDLIADLRSTAGSSGGITGAIGKGIRTGKYSPLSPENVVYQGIRDANQWMENWSRLSVYKSKLRQGFSEPEAAAITNKYMLNYQDLSAANRNLRYISPFITWTYKVVPLVTGTLFRDPKKILIPQRIIEAMNEEGYISEGVDVLPDWLKRGQSIILPKSIRKALPFGFGKTPQIWSLDTPTATAMRAYQPLFTLQEATKGKTGSSGQLARDVLNVIGLGGPAGIAKAGIETATGGSSFTGRQYKPGERVPTPTALVGIFGQTMDQGTYNMIQSLSPLIQRLNLADPLFRALGTETQQAEKVIESLPRQQLSALAGFSFYPYTKNVRNAELFRRKLLLDALIASMRDKGIEVPSRSNIEQQPTSGLIPPAG